ncbi:MAG: NUDIX hydrolase [Cyclobacteriaceae bacterium]|nr:NUDIX hydrolase [Cyclobacteriaceae bacterium]
MADFYSGEPKHLLAVDCVIFGFDKEQLKLLLVKRSRLPEKDNWSLMGDFLKEGENLEYAAQRVLTKWTGLRNVFLEQFFTFSDIDRDPGERVVSTAFYALIKIDESDKELTKSHGAEWIDIDKIPRLIFDHGHMVSMALGIIRHKSRFEPIGFELLPEKFTIPQLQKLYEAIMQQRLDNANFRKKILSMKVLRKLNEKEKGVSKRGAFYFQFDQEKYRKLNESGLLFEI